jgi:hypothetical protein
MPWDEELNQLKRQVIDAFGAAAAIRRLQARWQGRAWTCHVFVKGHSE